MGSASTVDAASISYDQAVEKDRSPLQSSPRHRESVRFATLAANSHNSQPWLFTAADRSISIGPDISRRCPAVDPDDHHLYASLGCAAENIVLAAAALGLRATPDVTGGAVVLSLEAAPAERSALFDAIPLRQSTRAKYDGRQVSAETLRQLERSGTIPGVSVLMLTERSVITKAAEFVAQGNSAQMNDKAFMAELVAWMRFSETDAVSKRDGLFARASGNPALPGWIARPLLRFVFTQGGENKKLREQIESSAGIAVFVSDRDDREHWVAAGRACQRFGLQATALGLKYAFVNQAVEVPAVREQFASFLGLAPRRPDLIVRFGTGPTLPYSLRRGPGQVLREAP